MGWELYLNKVVINDKKGPGGEQAWLRAQQLPLQTFPRLPLTSLGIAPQLPGQQDENVAASLTPVPLEHTRAHKSSSPLFTPPPDPGRKQLQPCCP